MRRRDVLAAALGAPLLGHWWLALAEEAIGPASAFNAQTVPRLAAALASRPYTSL